MYLDMKIFKNVISFFFLFIFINHASGLVYNTVIPIGELRRAVSNANPGDTLYVKSGEYRDLKITLNYFGKDRIFIMPEKKGSVTFSGNSTVIFEKSGRIVFSGFKFNEIQNSSSVILYNSSEIEINQNSFFRCGRNPFHTIVRIHNGSSQNIISDNVFDGSLVMSVVIVLRDGENFDNTRNKIIRNTFKNIPAVSSVYKGQTNGLEAIQLGQGEYSDISLFTQISGNYFENITGDGSEIISSKSSNNIISGNFFINNNSGITLRSGDNVLVSNNYLERTSQGIRIFGSGHRIVNNYIVDSDIAIQIPSTDIAFQAPSKASGYHQQNNLEVKENYIISRGDRTAISVGDNRRKINPLNVSLKNNHIYIDESARDFVIEKGISLNDVALRGNISYRQSNSVSKPRSSRFRPRELKYVDNLKGSLPIPSPQKIISNRIFELR